MKMTIDRRAQNGIWTGVFGESAATPCCALLIGLALMN